MTISKQTLGGRAYIHDARATKPNSIFASIKPGGIERIGVLIDTRYPRHATEDEVLALIKEDRERHPDDYDQGTDYRDGTTKGFDVRDLTPSGKLGVANGDLTAIHLRKPQK